MPANPLVIILNATAAAIHFPGGSPIGSRISVEGAKGPWREIIGVVRDSKYGSLTEDGVPVAYMPLAQNHETGMMLYVRASVPPASVVGPLRREIHELEPNLPVPAIEPMTQTIGTSLYAARMGAWLLAIFGGLAVLLAVVGIYGVLSFSISRRTREMGIRLALGADRQHVFLLVVRDGMLLVILGIVIGLGAGLAVSRSLGAFLLRCVDDGSANVCGHGRDPGCRGAHRVRHSGAPGNRREPGHRAASGVTEPAATCHV
jgi:hypothetical protein